MEPIIQQIVVGPMANFAYIFGCSQSKQVVLIDPSAEPEKLLSAVAELDAKLVAVVNTHGHVDHVAGNAAIMEATGAPLITHADAKPDQMDPMSHQFLAMLQGKPSPTPDRTVVEGDTIDVGEQSLQVIHTPGHTPGDMVLYTKGAVFTGDVLFVGGIGRTDLPGSSHAELGRSLVNKLAPLPDDTVVYPGHNYGDRPSSTIGQEKSGNPYMRAAMTGDFAIF